MRRAQQDADDAGLLTAWITGRSDQTVVKAVWSSLSRSVQHRSLDEHATGLLHRLDEVHVEWGIPGATEVTADVSAVRGCARRWFSDLGQVVQNRRTVAEGAQILATRSDPPFRGV